MSDEAYVTPTFSDIRVRFSHLRAYGRSALHGYHSRLDDLQKPTTAMQRGTAVHALLFDTRKVCGYPGAQRRGKEYDAFAAAHPEHEILTMAEYDKARAMADAVRAYEPAQPFLGGYFETKLTFDWNGMACRATPDIRGLDYVTELKTSASSDPVRFQWHALRMHYPAQLWFQHLACELNGYSIQHHYIICVEANHPYPVTVFEVQPRALDAAAKTLVLWSERLKSCEASGQFPPYAQGVVLLDVPDDEPDLIFEGDDE